MRKLGLVLMVWVAAACGGRSSMSNGVMAGAVGSREALDGFLASVQKKDLVAMSLVWGTTKGPAREHMDRTELEKRETLLQCFLRHDKYRVLDESRGEGERTVYKVELTQGKLVRSTTFKTIKGPESRWFLEDVDITSMQDFCQGR